MAQQSKRRQGDDQRGDTGTSPFEQLKDELLDYLEARAQELADRTGGKVGDLTGRLTDAAEGGGLAELGGRVLGGDSPLKATVAQTAKTLKDKAVGKAKEALGGGGGRKPGDTKVTNIVEVVDIGVPLRTVYDQWTQFEEFSSFTKGVRSVSKSDEIESNWNVKVGPSSRSWKATVEEQVPDERIVWTSEGAKGSTKGAVSFHRLGPRLTRIVVVVEYYPAGFFEKTGNLWRAQGRRLRLDLKHFARYVTLNADEEVEGWRGEIREGEVVRSHEEAMEDEAADGEYDEDAAYDEDEADEEDEYDDEDEAEEDGQAEEEDDEYTDEDEAGGADEDAEDEADEEPEEEPAARRRRRR